MANFSKRMKTSAQDGTSVTLVPEVGDNQAGDLTDTLTNIVLTFDNARDSAFFNNVNRRIQVTFQTL